MKILLVTPPFHRLAGQNLKYFMLGTGYLATALEEAGHQAHIYNAELENPGRIQSKPNSYRSNAQFDNDFDKEGVHQEIANSVWEEYLGLLDELRPDAVGFSSLTFDFHVTKFMARLTKEFDPSIRVVVGGPHVSALPEYSLDPAFDYVLAGAAENTLVELLSCLEAKADDARLAKIAGIQFQSDRVYRNQTQPEVDFARLGLPARHRCVFQERYNPMNWAQMMVSRGCPFHCTFCAVHTIHPRHIVYRSMDSIFEEISLLLDTYNAKYIQFHDSIFNVKRSFVTEFCNEIKRRNIKFNWRINAHVNTIDEEQLVQMQECGLDLVGVGAEVHTDQLLAEVGKKFNIQKLDDTVELFKKYKMNHTVNFIFGFKFDDEASLLKRAAFIKELDPQHVAFGNLAPLPGTAIFDEWIRDEHIDPAAYDWRRLSVLKSTNLVATSIAPERYAEILDQVHEIVDAVNKKNQAYPEGYFFD